MVQGSEVYGQIEKADVSDIGEFFLQLLLIRLFDIQP